LVAKIKSKTSQILIFQRNYSGFMLSLYDKNKDSLKYRLIWHMWIT
jgi:hypothetical protein